ncbi:GATA-domain-containing protein [Conidiobolus coronatus NRRL 28638]|uniref:GATA-domain-containing protein n=1 Tax=Conidiobolus coronatus (strain ATCC 28846 / CBS 209.66 / NRRL 28638) TaxID=796925 RepID=A0A137NXF9_CONC2|nr:GATA-domain-containing protein [Conidiobolus coronatus NRRL 28638]|eukprot:KXN67523.1 GATA-domain-containing protein [Conidiobolus coronatus NRRL 28638]
MTVCSNCGTTNTPLWRRGPDGRELCNACALYYKTRKQHRPSTFPKGGREQPKTVMNLPNAGTCPGNGKCNGTGGQSSCAGCPALNQNLQHLETRKCSHCTATSTPLWRKDKDMKTLCNACWLYEKLNGRKRPRNLKKDDLIKRRNRPVNNKNQGYFYTNVTPYNNSEGERGTLSSTDNDSLDRSSSNMNISPPLNPQSTSYSYDFPISNPPSSSLSHQDKMYISHDKVIIKSLSLYLSISNFFV